MIIQIGVILFIMYAAVFGFHGYAMYNILRIVVTVQALIYAASFYDDNKPVSALFGVIAILFNPLIKIHFSRSEWEVLDLGVAIIFAGTLAWIYWADNKNKKIQEAQAKEQEANHKRFEEIMAYKQKIRDITAEKQKLEESYWHLMRKNEKLKEELSWKKEDEDEKIQIFIEYHYRKIKSFSVSDINIIADEVFVENESKATVMYNAIDEGLFVRRDCWRAVNQCQYTFAIEIYSKGKLIIDYRNDDVYIKQALRDIYYSTMECIKNNLINKYDRCLD